ncbi:hypothetical protein LCGC14_2066230, partial [marine sediment metagenome]
MPHSNPFILGSSSFTKKIDLLKDIASKNRLAAESVARERFEPSSGKKSRFSKIISGIAGAPGEILDEAKNIGIELGKGTLKGFEIAGNQASALPATLFTKAELDEQGRLTTRRNLLGNPLANARSFVDVLKQTGELPEGVGPPGIRQLTQGFQTAQKVGQAFQEDPDIPAGVKFASSLLEPSIFVPAGATAKIASKLAPVAARSPRLGAKALRGGLGLLEGFDKPATVAKFAVGGSAGAEIAERFDIPKVPEIVERIALPLAGGIGATQVGRAGRVAGKQILKDLSEFSSADAMIHDRFPGYMSKEFEGEVGAINIRPGDSESVRNIKNQIDDSRVLIDDMEKLREYRDVELEFNNLAGLLDKLKEEGGVDTGFPSLAEITDIRADYNLEVGRGDIQVNEKEFKKIISEFNDRIENYDRGKLQFEAGREFRGDIEDTGTLLEQDKLVSRQGEIFDELNELHATPQGIVTDADRQLDFKLNKELESIEDALPSSAVPVEE